MKKFAILLTLSIFSICFAFGQTAVLRVSITHGNVNTSLLNIPSQLKHDSYSVMQKDSTTVYTFKLTTPEFVEAYFFNTSDRNDKYFTYLFYLSPGDDLSLRADFAEPGFDIKVSGRGSSNNQPLMSAFGILDKQKFLRDTLPYRVISVINADQRTMEGNFEKYVELYKPSQSYIKDWKMNLLYYSTDVYYSFKEENRLYVFDAYYRNYTKWQKISDSLFKKITLSNDAALGVFYYNDLISWVLTREREKFSDEESLHPVTFYRQWYNTDTVQGKQLYNSDRTNLVKEKIINRYFDGKTAEYLYTLLFDGAMNTANSTNIAAIFDRFKEKYSNSPYIPQFKAWVDLVIAKQKRTLNDKMVFLADNGSKLNTLEEVLSATRGKTVLVDMWGTWCAPCREEIEKNSTTIREHFKNKGLTYLYIANNDLNNGEQWKKLIAYFDMQGTHLLANQALTKDIMAKVKGHGFPTMFIIKKDGSYELSKSGYSTNLEVLYKQLDEALAE